MSIGEITTLSELWRSPEWRARSRCYTKGKACECCGGWAGDKYTDSKGKTRTMGLVPHHIEKHKWALPLYLQVQGRLYRQWLRGHDPEEVPSGLTAREQRRYICPVCKARYRKPWNPTPTTPDPAAYLKAWIRWTKDRIKATHDQVATPPPNQAHLV